MPSVGNTVKVLSIPEKVINGGLAVGYDVSTLIGTEAVVTHTDESLPRDTAEALGLTGAVWVEADVPGGAFALTPDEYELVSA